MAKYVESWSGEENSRCRLLVGMQKPDQDAVNSYLISIPGMSHIFDGLANPECFDKMVVRGQILSVLNVCCRVTTKRRNRAGFVNFRLARVSHSSKIIFELWLN